MDAKLADLVVSRQKDSKMSANPSREESSMYPTNAVSNIVNLRQKSGEKVARALFQQELKSKYGFIG